MPGKFSIRLTRYSLTQCARCKVSVFLEVAWCQSSGRCLVPLSFALPFPLSLLTSLLTRYPPKGCSRFLSSMYYIHIKTMSVLFFIHFPHHRHPSIQFMFVHVCFFIHPSHAQSTPSYVMHHLSIIHPSKLCLCSCVFHPSFAVHNLLFKIPSKSCSCVVVKVMKLAVGASSR